MRLHHFTSHINSSDWLFPGIIPEEDSEALPRLHKKEHRNQLTLSSAVSGRYLDLDELEGLFLFLNVLRFPICTTNNNDTCLY